MKKIILTVSVCFPLYVQCMDEKRVQKTPSLANLFIACHKMDRARQAIIFERLTTLEKKVDELSVADLAPMQVSLPNKPPQEFLVEELLRRIPILTELVSIQQNKITELEKTVHGKLDDLQYSIDAFAQMVKDLSAKTEESENEDEYA
jgi:hypothetical protein